MSVRIVRCRASVAGNAVKHLRSRLRQNLDPLVRAPKSGDFGYGQNAVNSSRTNASQRCAARLP
jgi:hypothetical protein